MGDQLANYKMQITSVMADEHMVQEKDGVYTIDSTANRITITPAICNYRLNDLKVCVYVDGLDEKKLRPITMKNGMEVDIPVFTAENKEHWLVKLRLCQCL